MKHRSERFADLFKKYRLKSQFLTLSSFGSAMAENGFNFEDSIYSHWQNGTRNPQNRAILLVILKIFIEKHAITTLSEANEVIVSVGQGALTPEEINKLPIMENVKLFQVPNEIDHFYGRDEIISTLNGQDLKGKKILLYGASGVGKTALAIRLGHLLRDKYPDGVLWYKVENDNLMDITYSLARVLGEDISHITNLQVRFTVVRSLLTGKNILLFLDGVDSDSEIHHLIPNSKTCTTILTSQSNHLNNLNIDSEILVKPFTENEVKKALHVISEGKLSESRTAALIHVTGKFGNLPLAVSLFTKQVIQMQISDYEIEELAKSEKSITRFYRKDNSLMTAISLTYKNLNEKLQSVLLSTSIFNGKDFTVKTLSYVNDLTEKESQRYLNELEKLSFIEKSTEKSYHTHPAITDFLRTKLNFPRSSMLQYLATFIFIFYTLFWIYLQLFINKGSNINFIFTSGQIILSLFGGIFGINTSLNWGGMKTLMGKAILMFSLGLLSQLFGFIIYSVLYLQNKTIYPSIGDIGYSATIPLYIYGIWPLAKAVGISENIKKYINTVVSIVIILFLLSVIYYLKIHNFIINLNDVVKLLFDFWYTVGDAIYVSLGLLVFITTLSILDGIMRTKALLLLLALFFRFLADLVFNFQTSLYYPGGLIDYICFFMYYAMTIAILSFKTLRVNVKNIHN